MRLTSDFVVGALVRQVQAAGAFATVAHKGDPTAGAIFVLVDGLDGEVALYGPAPQVMAMEELPASVRDASQAMGNRLFCAIALDPEPNRASVDAVIARERRFDPDLWLIDIEDRQRRAFIPLV